MGFSALLLPWFSLRTWWVFVLNRVDQDMAINRKFPGTGLLSEESGLASGTLRLSRGARRPECWAQLCH